MLGLLACSGDDVGGAGQDGMGELVVPLAWHLPAGPLVGAGRVVDHVQDAAIHGPLVGDAVDDDHAIAGLFAGVKSVDIAGR